jgi:hypothetical protein
VSFDKAHLRSVFADVETYLGYLKGNELAADYLWQTVYYFGDHDQTPGPDTTIVDLDRYPSRYEFPCPDGQYAVHPRLSSFTVAYDRHSIDPNGPDPFAALAKDIRDQTDQAWRNGASWASGLGDSLYSLCAQFAEPDVPALAETIRAMQRDVVAGLEVGARDDWANIGALLSGWEGHAQYAFSTFYDNYNDTVAQLAVFSAYVTAGFAAATKIINGTQLGVTKYAESLRSAAQEQLGAWVRAEEQPADTPQDPAWIAKVEEIAKDAYGLLDHIPVVSVAKGQVDKAISIGNSLKDIAEDVGIDVEPPHEERPFKARTADELYTDATSTLEDDYYRPYDTAMNRLQSGDGPTDPNAADQVPFSGQAVQQLLQSLKDRYDWGLPSVPDESMAPGNHY